MSCGDGGSVYVVCAEMCFDWMIFSAAIVTTGR